MNRPPLLLADEPTSDLDEESEAEVIALLLELHRQYGTTLVVVTHSERLAEQADRVILLRKGSIAGERVPTMIAPATALDTASPLRTSPVALADAPLSPALPGAGVGQFAISFSIWLAVVVFGILAANLGTSLVQRRAISQRQAERRSLEEAALQQVRADVAQLAYGTDGAYRLTLYLQNTDPQQPIYAMTPGVRVFVQVDRGWVEAPSHPPDGQEDRVTQLAGRREYVYEFTPAIQKFEEQITGYMHVRITSNTLLSRGAKPGDGLFERTDDYYVYLKPHGADDAAIMRANRWSSRPPLWIPMPAH